MEIIVGKTYANRGAGQTTRKVLGIGNEFRPSRWCSSTPPPNEPGVLYEDNAGRRGKLYLRSFKVWAGKEVR